jgi:hypothetical protein
VTVLSELCDNLLQQIESGQISSRRGLSSEKHEFKGSKLDWPRIPELLMLGNKRSGTSHFVRVANLHPNLFISHEADVVWILYQWSQRLPYCRYAFDGRLGMEATLRACGHLLEAISDLDLRGPLVPKMFRDILLHLRTNGSAVQVPFPTKAELTWIGDKKPVQNSDPTLQSFIRTHFPSMRYIHIVRDPTAVISSMLRAGRTWAREYWGNVGKDELLARWTRHEEWVLQIKAANPASVVTVRFEDFIRAPVSEMARVCEFLQLPMPGSTADAIRALPQRPRRRCAYKFKTYPARTMAILSRYGYL